MSEQSIGRTRRNVIGVSVVIGAVNLFGWRFPEQWNFFGAQFAIDPVLIERALWLALVYFSWEFFVQTRVRRHSLENKWVQSFLATPKITKRVNDWYKKNFATDGMLEKFVINAVPQSVKILRADDIVFVRAYAQPGQSIFGLKLFGRRLDIVIQVNDGDSNHNVEAKEYDGGFEIYYLSALPAAAFACFQTMVFDEEFIEIATPFLFALGAAAAFVFDQTYSIGLSLLTLVALPIALKLMSVTSKNVRRRWSQRRQDAVK